jgi:hypothetical protein
VVRLDREVNVVLLAGKRASGTVPLDRFEAFSEVRLAPETAPKEPLHVPEVIVPTVSRNGIEVIKFCVEVDTSPIKGPVKLIA